MKPTETIPTFRDENEEREFWEHNDVIDYFDTSKVKRVRFPNLKKTTKSITINKKKVKNRFMQRLVVDVPSKTLYSTFQQNIL